MIRFILTAIIGLGSTSVGFGAERLSIDLAQALQLAAELNPGLNNSSLDVEEGDVLVREAYSAALPRLEANLALTHFMLAPETYIPNFGRVRFTPLNNASGDLKLQQPLWLAGKVGIALEAAKTYRKLARENLQSARAQLKSKVIQDYYGLLLAREAVNVTQAALEQAARHAETVRKMLEVGMVSEFDRLRAEVEVRSLEPELASAQKNAELTHQNLKMTLGVSSVVELILLDSLGSIDPEGDKIPVPTLEDAFGAALRSRPEFRLMDLQTQLGGLQLKADKRSIYWPNIFLGLGYSSAAQEDKGDKILNASAWSSSATWTLGMQIPLFDGFATQSRIEKSRIALRRLEVGKRTLDYGVRMEVVSVLEELNRTVKQVESLNAALHLAEKTLKIAEVRYVEGAGTELEVLDAQLILYRARLGYLNGLFAWRVAKAEYARVIVNDNDFSRVDG